jgi:CheY-like chemotaxis protein
MRNEIKTVYDFKGKIILVADDILINFKLLEAIMTGTNATLLWAKNGREAIQICHDHEFIDLVLMDLEMPDMNGIEATREIKKFRKNIPVIAQTAYGAYFAENEILEAGCTQVISKPFLPEVILTTVAKYL